MIIEIPKSLYDHIKYLEDSIERYKSSYYRNYNAFGSTEMAFRGPFGVYGVRPKPDKEFTKVVREYSEEKVIVHHEVREYKDD